MALIDRTKVNGLIENTNGLIFGAEFIKKDGTVRTMNCRKGVTKHLKGGVNNVVRPDNSYITVFSMNDKGYRTLNLATLCRIRISGETYEVVN